MIEHNEHLNQRIATGLAKLSLALRQRSWQEAMPQGLTPTQGQILSHLLANPGTTLGEVASGLGVKPATASTAVRVLVDKGLVKKSKRPDDARALVLELTAEGSKRAEQTVQWPDFLASAVDTLKGEERRVLYRALLILIRTLQARGQIPVAAMCVTCRYFRPNVHRDPGRPHHCAFVDEPFGDEDLHIDCGDHEEATPGEARIAWQRFTDTT